MAPPPPELVEVILMEKFYWLPKDIDNIKYKKIQEIFTVIRQREISTASGQK
jgi:hypothetical protein